MQSSKRAPLSPAQGTAPARTAQNAAEATPLFRACSPKETEVFRAVLRLAEGGSDLSAVRVQEIADAAGMGKGTLYEYFKSKDEILRGTAGYCISEELANLARLVAQSESFEQLVTLSLAYIAGLVGHRVAAYQMVAQVLREGLTGMCTLLPEAEAAKAQLGVLMQRGWSIAVQSGVSETLGIRYYSHVTMTALMGCASAECRLLFEGALTAEKQQELEDYTRRMLCGALGIPTL